MAAIKNCPPLTRSSVIAAHELVKPYTHYTPVLTNSTITSLASTSQTPESLVGTKWEGHKPTIPKIRIWFKCENLQRVGAFKARGAFHAIQRLMAEEGWEENGGRSKGVITHSSGNFAQALALAAQTMSIPATIIMPTISTPSKIAATQGYGARVIFSGSTSSEREAVVATEMEKIGAVLVHPYDHPDIILGQGTLGLELQAQVAQMIASSSSSPESAKSYSQAQPKCSFAIGAGDNPGAGMSEHNAGATGANSPPKQGLDAVIAPCGGGGMLSGIALSCAGTGIFVFGAEPSFEGADDCRRGLALGSRVERVSSLTIADGLRTPVGEFPWRIIRDPEMVRGVYAVTEDQIRDALRLVLERMKVVVEPSAVVGLAVALYNEDFRSLVEREGGEEGWDLGVVLSGGNVSLEALARLFATSGEKGERQEGKVGADGKRVAEGVAG